MLTEKRYRIIEVIKERTATTRGESIIRSISYKTIEEAQSRITKMEPKENGKLKIEVVWF